jgi:hypothetical protein
MRILTDESTGEKFEIHPAPHGGRDVEMVEVKKEPRRIDWSKVNLDVVPVKAWDHDADYAVTLYLMEIAHSPMEFFDEEVSFKHASLITGKRISWSGGNCPLPEGVIVKAFMRHPGSVGRKDEARNFRWAHSGARSDEDIIAFEIAGIAEGWVE